jgi:hypothetical protein
LCQKYKDILIIHQNIKPLVFRAATHAAYDPDSVVEGIGKLIKLSGSLADPPGRLYSRAFFGRLAILTFVTPIENKP